ncbi:MAG: hypothetical protein VB088_04825 [Sphaerochaeta sp.]|jgi:hypothetical protein|nr:hypothetical protein [Sphaerochaeta sp.]
MKRFLLLGLLMCIIATMAFAVPYYDKGNQMFSFTLGTTFPTFTYFFEDKDFRVGFGENNTGAKVGGYGAISYQVFNSPTSAIGGEIGYDFNFSASNMLFTAVPFYAKYSFFPVQGQWDLPISFGLGGAYIKYNDASLMTLFGNVQVGLTWYPGDNWGFGLTTGLWLIPEFNYKEELQQYNGVAGFIPLTLSITYRQ